MNSVVMKFIEAMSIKLPFDDRDMLKAIEVGRQIALHEVKDNMVGMSVNGTLQNILTEQKLKELINGYKPVNIEDVREVCKEKRIR